ncbi:hypothetical protein BCR34DRAFT_607326 [Clohesyomyces aquaticus]|uniref:Uncharacterized protein n=1 Tax=Clohesyomyces aquaticus TaxID=1231657 RepID=A0A1Y1YGZ4_9PLEO|nr:hypothetical protein BCR34DRAFT_607326 [Clohesyomyces aquaticus]
MPSVIMRTSHSPSTHHHIFDIHLALRLRGVTHLSENVLHIEDISVLDLPGVTRASENVLHIEDIGRLPSPVDSVVESENWDDIEWSEELDIREDGDEEEGRQEQNLFPQAPASSPVEYTSIPAGVPVDELPIPESDSEPDSEPDRPQHIEDISIGLSIPPVPTISPAPHLIPASRHPSSTPPTQPVLGPRADTPERDASLASLASSPDVQHIEDIAAQLGIPIPVPLNPAPANPSRHPPSQTPFHSLALRLPSCRTVSAPARPNKNRDRASYAHALAQTHISFLQRSVTSTNPSPSSTNNNLSKSTLLTPPPCPRLLELQRSNAALREQLVEAQVWNSALLDRLNGERYFGENVSSGPEAPGETRETRAQTHVQRRVRQQDDSYLQDLCYYILVAIAVVLLGAVQLREGE